MSDERDDAGGLRSMAMEDQRREDDSSAAAAEGGITIYVSGITRSVTEADLEDLFGQKHGKVNFSLNFAAQSNPTGRRSAHQGEPWLCFHNL